MARVYGFIKIEKKQTPMGLVTTGIGIASMLCLTAMIVYGFILGGKLPPLAGLIGYVSFAAALLGLKLSSDLRKNVDAYGPMVHNAIYFNIAAVVYHAVIFFIGCLTVIL